MPPGLVRICPTSVPLVDGAVTLTWCGGDPNPADSPTYTVHWGTTADDLAPVGTVTGDPVVTRGGLQVGTTYFWQIVSSDAHGAETPGAIWQFRVRDDPPRVTTLTADGQADGHTVALDWSGYDETVHGNIDHYRIYAQSASFFDVTGLTAVDTVPAGQFSAQVTALTTGAAYWLAVVAVDPYGNHQTGVTAVSAVPQDVIAPGEVSDLAVQCLANALAFSWIAPPDPTGDLAGYRLFVDGGATPVELPAGQTLHTLDALAPASHHTVTIATVDAAGNQSTGRSIDGVTLLANPANLTATPSATRVGLSWDGVTPAQYIRHYAVYLSPTAVTSVAGLTPHMTVAGTTAVLSLPAVNTPYYLAVTTVNASGGEDPAVQPVQVQIAAPALASVTPSHVSPVGGTEAFRLTLVFNTAMAPGTEPVIGLDSSGAVDPTVPASGTWLTSAAPNDTYVTPQITLAGGMDGTITVSVSGAADALGNTMDPVADGFTFELDATPPGVPAATVTATTCASATLDWSGYAPPADLAGFRIYLTDRAFVTLEEISPLTRIDASRRSHALTGLALDTTYHAAVGAIDATGNLDPGAAPVEIRIPRMVPPAVDLTLLPGSDPGQARLSWEGYDAASACGLDAFWVFSEPDDVTTIDGLTPVAILPADSRTFLVDGLDRRPVRYFAVVGVNDAGQHIAGVSATAWSDPYGGDVTADLTMGGGEQRVIAIHHTLTVSAGAILTVMPGTTLHFAPGTGLLVASGALMAEGTALEPIVFTSAADTAGGSPQPGDWEGVTLSAGASGSILDHVVVRYGRGLHLTDVAPTVEAFSALYNAGAGLLVDGAAGASLTTTAALVCYNAVGVRSADNGWLEISDSVIRDNARDAVAAGSQPLTATGNWWGAVDTGQIQAALDGDVGFEPFLDHAPLLTPAAGTSDGRTQVTAAQVDLRLACRTAEEMRLSEDSTFAGVFFTAFSPAAGVALSPGGGDKHIFVQFKSVTGAVCPPIQLDVTYVTEGPRIESVNLEEGQAIARPLTVMATATAPLGVVEMHFSVNDEPVHSTAGDTLTTLWDVRDLPNGTHRVRLEAWDVAGNPATLEVNVTLALVPPPAPVLLQPAAGVRSDPDPVSVGGTAEPGVEVRVTRNGDVVGVVTAAADGTFSLPEVAIHEGANTFAAQAADPVGVSGHANAVHVVLDSAVPAPVVLLAPECVPGDGVVLQWRYAEQGERPTRFRLFRHDAFFSDPADAVLICDQNAPMSWVDDDRGDGTWYYGAVGTDAAGNSSTLSAIVSVTCDHTAPLLAVSYAPDPPVGAAPVQVTLTADEPLAEPPALAITSPGSPTPTAVALAPAGESTWTGTYIPTGQSPAGTARVRAAGRDLFGNVFAGAPSGPALVIDTVGPSGAITTDPAGPVQVLEAVEPVTVDLTLTLSEPAASPPALEFTPPQGDPMDVDVTGAGTAWTGTLQLTTAMGTGNGQFTLQALDACGNPGTHLTTGEHLEIYTAPLPPPPPVPEGLTAQALPAGAVALTWEPVPLADTYRLHRSSGDCQPAPDAVVADGLTAATITDQPPADGTWCYAVSAVRLGSAGAASDPVAVTVDATPPDLPQNLQVSLGDGGMVVSWDAPAQGEAPAGYRVYRNATLIRETATLTILDHPPAGGQYAYAVASVDAVGNENRSDTVDVDLTVGAVDALAVTLDHGGAPEIAWSCTAPEVAGYHVYRGDLRLTAAPLTATRYVDQGHAGTCMVRYRVVAVDADGHEGPPRAVELFPVILQGTVNPDAQGVSQPLLGGVFNRFRVMAANRCGRADWPLETLQLEVTAEGCAPIQQSVALDTAVAQAAPCEHDFIFAPATAYVPHRFTVSAVQRDAAGNRVTYRRSVETDGVLPSPAAVTVSTADLPLAGGMTTVRVCIRNSGYAPMQIVAGRDNGSTPGEIWAAVTNRDGLEVARAAYAGLPAGSRLLADGTVLVTLDPDGRLCVEIPLLVPATLDPDATIHVMGGVVHLYSAYGDQAELSCAGPSGSTASGLAVAAYSGTAVVDPEAVIAAGPVVISGQALKRDTAAPLPDTPLKIGFATRGHHWFTPVTTDDAGGYTLAYTPPPGLSGEVTVWAAHPDVFALLDQDRFHLYRLYCAPASGDIRMSKADRVNFRLELYNPDEVPVTVSQVAFRAYTVDAEGNETPMPELTGGLADGASIDELAPGERRNVDLRIDATPDAPDHALAQMRFVTADGAAATFTANLTLLPAVPLVAVVEPAAGYVDVSLDRGTLLSRRVTVANQGLADLENVALTLPAAVAWMTTNLARAADGRMLLGDLAVGASRTFDVVFAPPADTPFGYHQDTLVLTGGNTAQRFPIHLTARVTSNLTGAVHFSVRNILDQAVEGAVVRMRNGLTRQEITPVHTAADGLVLVSDLAEGEWNWQVTAPGHAGHTGVVTVIADQTAATDVFLLKQLVTITFSVEPVPFTDRYEIKIEQTFETHVPAPVLVVDPPKVQFDDVTGPFEVMLDVTVSNHGLIALHDVSVGSQTTPWGALEPLIDFLPELGAMQSIVIPYRLTFHGMAAWDAVVAQSISGEGGRSPENCGDIPDGLFPPSDPRKPTAREIIDCLTGLGGLLNAMATMQSLLQGCYQCVDAGEPLAVMGTMAAIIIGSGTGDPASFLANAMICFAQAFLKVSFSGESDGNYSDVNRKVSGGWSYGSDVACFAAGTPIRMADGSRRPIETLRPGDRVMAFDGNSDTVKRVYRRSNAHLREVWYRHGKTGAVHRLVTTDGHLFWVKGRRWVQAAALAPGDGVMTAAKTVCRVEKNARLDQRGEVYNFDVHHYRSYFAGGVLVHEKCGSPDDDPLTRVEGWQ